MKEEPEDQDDIQHLYDSNTDKDIENITILFKKKSLGEMLGNSNMDEHNVLKEDQINFIKEKKKREALKKIKKRNFEEFEYDHQDEVEIEGIGKIKKIKQDTQQEIKSETKQSKL